MPIYVYVCKECGFTKELIRPVDERNDMPKCDNCEAEMRRTYAPTPVIFKGGGFYGGKV